MAGIQAPKKTSAEARMPTTQEPGSEDMPEARHGRNHRPRMAATIPPQTLRMAADDMPQPRQRLDELIYEAYAEDPTVIRIKEAMTRGDRQSKLISLGECETTPEGWIRYRKKLLVPDSAKLLLRLLQDHHDAPAAGHPGRAKTLELLGRTYYWKTMRSYVEKYVGNCHTCQRTKAVRHATHGTLRPLPVPNGPWQDISMDFVTGLPESGTYDAVWVVVDRLTKVRHFVPCNSTVDAKQLADLFLTHIFRLHGLPISIVSDRGPQIAARFWQHLCHCLRIEPRLSTAFHPETDGQTERMNAVMEQYLRAYVNYLQDDWIRYLALAEFATNNQVSETTGVSPFYALHGYDPRWTTELDIRQDNPEEHQAQQVAERLDEIHAVVKAEMAYAQARQQEGADRRRIPAPVFHIGDKVWLNAKNLRTRRPSRKLDDKRFGPFRVTRPIGDHAYELQLPDTMRVHPVFHVSLLDPVRRDGPDGQRRPRPPPVVVDGEVEHEVDAVLDSRLRNGRLSYLVKWTGFPDPTWEPA